jgi:hypothetical protein
MTTPSRYAAHLRASLSILAFACVSSRLPAEPFTLTDKQGRSITADVLSLNGGQVKIKRSDGQIFELPLSSLADADQATLRTWAQKEAAKPLPAGAIQVELSRGNFKTEKRDMDVTLVNGDIIKNGRTVTEEKWGYGVMIANKTSQPLGNLHTEYRLFATVDDVHTKEKQGLKKKSYRSVIETIPELGRITFRTETVSAIKTKYNGNIVSAKSGESSSRETLRGIWIKIYRGEELIYETATPDSLRTSETW